MHLGSGEGWWLITQHTIKPESNLWSSYTVRNLSLLPYLGPRSPWYVEPHYSAKTHFLHQRFFYLPVNLPSLESNSTTLRVPITSWACLEKESALAIMAAVLSSSSPSFWPLSSSAIRARARSPTTPDAAPFMPSMPPGPGMCWARLRDAFPAVISPTETKAKEERKC